MNLSHHLLLEWPIVNYLAPLSPIYKIVKAVVPKIIGKGLGLNKKKHESVYFISWLNIQ
jgi:hypothetical protein